jgi:hypothetical protein
MAVLSPTGGVRRSWPTAASIAVRNRSISDSRSALAAVRDLVQGVASASMARKSSSLTASYSAGSMKTFAMPSLTRTDVTALTPRRRDLTQRVLQQAHDYTTNVAKSVG